MPAYEYFDDNADGFDPVIDTVIIKLLREHNRRLPEKAIQAYLFYVDYRTYEEMNTVLLHADWGAYMYGFYSHKVHDRLDELSDIGAIREYSIVKDGNRMYDYEINDPDSIEYLSRVARWVDTIIDEIRDYNITPDNVCTWCKDNEVFKQSEYESVNWSVLD